MTRLLIFSILKIRPDIAFATLVVSCFAKNLSQQHTKVVKTIMHYLEATKIMEIMYKNGKGNGSLIIKDYSDSNWASN